MLAVAFANRGLAHFKKSNLSEALDDYDLSIKLNSRYAAAYLGRSEVLFRMGKTDAATSDEKKGSRFLSQAQTAYDEGYQAYWDSKFELAIDRYTDAIEINPLFAYAYYGRAEVHYYRKNWSQAAEDYEVAVRLMSPKDVWYESGKKHLEFSRIYARRSGSKEIGKTSRDGCAELRGPEARRSSPASTRAPSPAHPSSN